MFNVEGFTEEKVCTALKHLQAIKATAGVKNKALVMKQIPDEDAQYVKAVFMWAYEPTVTYGIKSLRDVSCGKAPQEPVGFEPAMEVFGGLSTRELTGTRALDACAYVLDRLSEDGRELFSKIIARDLRIGASVSTINKAFPGLITKFSPMLAKKYESRHIKSWPVGVEIKWDGVRALIMVKLQGTNSLACSVDVLSRSGKPLGEFDDTFTSNVAAFAGEYGRQNCKTGETVVLDGEIVSGQFNETISAVRGQDADKTNAVFHVFHALSLGEFTAGSKEGNGRRYMRLRDALKSANTKRQNPLTRIQLSTRYLAHSEDEIMTIYGNVRKRGLEGVIVKPIDGGYEPKRSNKWLKIKGEDTLDLKVVGAFEGEGKYAGMLGGLVVDNDGVQVNVGGGFSDAQRGTLWNEYWQDKNDEAAGNKTTDETGWILGRIVEVEYQEVTPDGSLRHPRFKRFRDTTNPGFKE